MLNIVAIMGRLARDPELRQTTGGKSVATFTVACDRPGRRDAGGQSTVDWIPVTAWEGTAEFVYKYFQKGQLIAVDGRLQSRTYQDKSGNNRTAIEIVARNVHFAGSKPAAGTQQDAAYAAPAQRPAGLDDDPYEAISDDEGDLPF